MADLEDGESVEMKGSAASPYVLKNSGGVFSCTCPAWRNQSVGIEARTCKHLKKLRGEAVELARVGGSPAPVKRPKVAKEGAEDEGGEGDEVVKAPVLLAHPWTNDIDLTGWWMSEKLDGVRAYWDGAQFLSRLGNKFHAPTWFTEGLPSTPLDGELWGGRKKFQSTVGVVKRQDKSEHWKTLKYVVFDAPALDAPFEERLRYCEDFFAKTPLPYAHHHPHVVCNDVPQLKAELARVEALGGEGLMLRKPGSRYEIGRSSTLLKVKSFFDAEARVVEHTPGAGRHKGRTGALVAEMPTGKRFSIGTGLSDAERNDPPPIGALVTYRYQELTEAGVPRFPSYVGLAIDKALPAPATDAAKPAAIAAEPTKQAVVALVAPEAAAKAAAPAAASEAARRFEFDDGSSSKFWSIQVAGSTHTVTYGRIGTSGQSKTKTFASEALAKKDADALVAEKTKKGYEAV